jgi:S-formylglutathione hydrolase FrmB
MDTPVPPPAEAEAAAEAGSPHSVRSIVLRLLVALAIAAGFFVVDRVWLEDDPQREQYGAKVKTFAIESDLLDRELPTKVVVPERAEARGRSMLLFLHGRNEDERSYLVEPMFEAVGDLGKRAPVVAFPSGGGTSYWHNRESGPWASYVLTEAIPQLIARYDVDPDRVVIGGISMGGYGALNIARIAPDRFCGVGAHSPALWESADETAQGAFDDTEDFDRNDVIALAGATDPGPYAGLRLWLDAGEDDPFLDGDEAFEQAVRANGGRPVVKRSPGGHDNGYWNDNWDEYFGFYAHALNECTIGDEEEPDEEPGRASGSSSRRSGEAPGSGGSAGGPP